MNIEKQQSTKDFYSFTTTRPVAIFMIVIAVCVFGMVSYDQLALNLMPDISYPSLTVRTEYPGTAPEEVETTISRPIEQELGVVSNLVSISSISKAGFSDIILEFTWDTDMSAAVQDVREKLDQVFLPPEAKKPLILRYDPTLDPILRLGLYGELSLFAQRYIAEEEIKRELETLDGVAAVKVRGGLEEEIRVELNERQLVLLGLDIQEVNRRLAQENINLAGGNLKEGQTEYLVRTLNEFRNENEIANLAIGRRQGVDIRVKDVGTVTRTNKEREVITRVNGKESVEIEIYKEADANIVTVAAAVKNRIFGTPEQQAFVANLKKRAAEPARQNGEAKPAEKKDGKGDKGKGDAAAAQAMLMKRMTNFMAYQLPPNTGIKQLSDQSVFIKSAVDEVKGTAIMGGVLAIVVLYIFLRRVWNTIIVAIAIPISVIATFGPMFMFDVTLNIMSLGGLALGIGMLVDNSIVVLESIHRLREEGHDIITACVRGASTVGGAVLASTLTTVAVFFPIVFVKGVAGQIFGDMALTVVFSLLASLVVALFVVPMLASRMIKEEYLADIRGRFSDNHILRLSIIDDFKNFKARREEQHASVLGFVAGALLRFGREFIVNLVVLLGAALLSILKSVALLLIFVPTLLLGWIPPLRKYVRWLEEWSAQPNFRSFTIHQRVWDTLLVFKSYPIFVSGWRDFAAKFKAAKLLKRIARVVLFPLYLVYAIARFVIHHLFSTLLKTALAFLFAIAFFVSILLLLVGLPVGLFFAGVLLVANPLLNWSYRTYPTAIRWALANRGSVIGVSAASFAVCMFILMPRLGLVLIPEVHQGEFNVEARFPIGTPVELTDEKLQPLAQIALQQSDVQKIATVSGAERTSQSSSDEGEHTAKVTLTLKGNGDFASREERLIERLRAEFRNVPDVETKISRPALFSFKTPIEIEIKGYNLAKLKALSKEAETRIAQIPGMKDVRSNLQTGNPEVQIVYDRDRLAYYGLNINEVASIVRNKVQGIVATEFREADRRIDIRVKVNEDDKAGIDELSRLVVNPNQAVPIPLAAIADIRVKEGPSEIRRIEQQRAALITANVSGLDLRSASEQIYATLQELDMPDDFAFAVTGQNAEMETSMNSLMLALALAIFLIYVVMASQFESLLHPFVIMFTIPLALIGVIAILFVLQIPLSVVVFIGMIMLAGIVVNNAIVLVDYINHLRRQGMEKLEAIVQAGSVRLRPILMTTATTVLGLLPMALGLGEGAEIRTPMAITVIAGLISSTVLTLIVIPTVYAVLDRSK
ncbi:efflux RND transporter permease subunit [candidate division KSB1 bacterium]|nr:efflux RND transporter permease subunit [candidate division KSB1 bacterium]